MIVKAGTQCATLCCKQQYVANNDFETKEEPLVSEGIVYLRGKCFPCMLRTEIAPQLLKAGIRLLSSK